MRNLEMQTADGKTNVDRLGDIATMLEKSRLELREAENSRDALRRQIVGEEPVLLPESPGADASISLPEIDGRIDAQKRNLDTLLQKYTDKHPDVIGTRRLIKDLEEQKREEIISRRKFAQANPGAGISNNPAFQQLKVSLGEAEASVASLRTRVAEYESRYKRTKEMMKSMPQLEAEFTQLNRDYEIHKKNYEQLVTRRESAELTGDLESAGGGADFRLIDPPRVSLQTGGTESSGPSPARPVAGNCRRSVCCLRRQSVATGFLRWQVIARRNRSPAARYCFAASQRNPPETGTCQSHAFPVGRRGAGGDVWCRNRHPDISFPTRCLRIINEPY